MAGHQEACLHTATDIFLGDPRTPKHNTGLTGSFLITQYVAGNHAAP